MTGLTSGAGRTREFASKAVHRLSEHLESVRERTGPKDKREKRFSCKCKKNGPRH